MLQPSQVSPAPTGTNVRQPPPWLFTEVASNDKLHRWFIWLFIFSINRLTNLVLFRPKISTNAFQSVHSSAQIGSRYLNRDKKCSKSNPEWPSEQNPCCHQQSSVRQCSFCCCGGQRQWSSAPNLVRAIVWRGRWWTYISHACAVEKWLTTVVMPMSIPEQPMQISPWFLDTQIQSESFANNNVGSLS